MKADQLLSDLSKAEAKADHHNAKADQATVEVVSLELRLLAAIKKSRVSGVIHRDIDSQRYRVYFAGRFGLECIEAVFSDRFEMPEPAKANDSGAGPVCGRSLASLLKAANGKPAPEDRLIEALIGGASVLNLDTFA